MILCCGLMAALATVAVVAFIFGFAMATWLQYGMRSSRH
jgi:hypothetical protein